MRVSKTDTIKKRAIYVYLPSLEMAQRWKELASRQGSSISKFVTEHVENSLHQEEGEEGFVSRAELMKKVTELESQVGELSRERRMLRTLVEKLERDLKVQSARPFLDEEFEGIRSFDRDLVELLRMGKPLMDDELLEGLGLEHDDIEARKIIGKQLESLESYGLVKATNKGWVWKG